jgi:hypothetical protein
MTDEPTFWSAHVRGELDLRMVTGQYSSCLVTELARCLERRSTTGIFPILAEIGCLEGAPHSRPASTKAAAPFTRPLLSGLWHKHYFQAAFIPKNILNHWKSEDFSDRAKAIMQDQAIPDDTKDGAQSHAFVLDAYRERGESREITGEWIVYARHQDVNYYLTLGTHEEGDAAIRNRVLACCYEFPHLDIFGSGDGGL